MALEGLKREVVIRLRCKSPQIYFSGGPGTGFCKGCHRWMAMLNSQGFCLDPECKDDLIRHALSTGRAIKIGDTVIASLDFHTLPNVPPDVNTLKQGDICDSCWKEYKSPGANFCIRCNLEQRQKAYRNRKSRK